MSLSKAEINKLTNKSNSPLRYMIEYKSSEAEGIKYEVYPNLEHAQKKTKNLVSSPGKYREVKLHRILLEKSWEPVQLVDFQEIKQ